MLPARESMRRRSCVAVRQPNCPVAKTTNCHWMWSAFARIVQPVRLTFPCEFVRFLHLKLSLLLIIHVEFFSTQITTKFHWEVTSSDSKCLEAGQQFICCSVSGLDGNFSIGQSPLLREDCPFLKLWKYPSRVTFTPLYTALHEGL